MDRVAGKIALVTGAASGLGEASVRLLAREGATVVLTDLHEAAGRAVLGAIEAEGGSGLYLHLDVAREDDWIAAMAEVRQRYGRLNGVLNCAGTNIARSFPTDTTLDDWRRLMSINLDGVFLGTKHALLAMQDSNPVNGSIINISSIMGLIGMPDIAAYNASKGGVRLYSKSVAERKLNIRVNTIHPGFIHTLSLPDCAWSGTPSSVPVCPVAAWAGCCLRHNRHAGPHWRVRRQHAVIPVTVGTRRWHQGCDALYQLQRGEHQIDLFAVALRLRALVDQISALFAQSIQGKRSISPMAKMQHVGAHLDIDLDEARSKQA